MFTVENSACYHRRLRAVYSAILGHFPSNLGSKPGGNSRILRRVSFERNRQLLIATFRFQNWNFNPVVGNMAVFTPHIIL